MENFSSIVQLQDVSLRYGRNLLFSGLSFVLQPGAKVLLSTQSGGGKSSLLEMLMGFRQPDSGQIIMFDQLLSEKTIDSIRKQIAYLPQEPPAPDIKLTDFLQEIFSYRVHQKVNFDTTSLTSLIGQFFDKRDILHEKLNHFSVGERKRVYLIIALLLNRKLLLLDEPMAGLDEKNRDLVAEILISYRGSIIMASHEQTEKLQYWQELSL